MSALASFSTAVSTLREQPGLFVAGLLVTLIGQLSLVAPFGYPYELPHVWSAIVLSIPFLLGGFVGAADDALAGSASVRGYVAAGAARYLATSGALVLLATLLGITAAVAIVDVASLRLLAGGLGLTSIAEYELTPRRVGLVGVAAVVPVWIGLQFFAAAVVVSEDRPLTALAASVVRFGRHRAGVCKFTALFAAVLVLPRIPDLWLYWDAIVWVPPKVGPSGQEIPGHFEVASESRLSQSMVVGSLVGTIAVTVALTYYVSYYRSLPGGGRDGPSPGR